MTSFYSVVQYLPDPIIDERINFGVVVFGGGQVRSRFLRDWHRVRAFRGGDIAFLREFADQFSQKQEVMDVTGLRPLISEVRLHEIAGNWTNCIQLCEPKASLLEPDALLDDVASRFLRDSRSPARGFRDRRAAVRLAEETLRVEMEERLGESARDLTHRNHKVRGKAGEYEFDLVVARGTRVLVAVAAISFELGDLPEVERQLHATAWELDDVRRYNPSTRRALVVLPPTRDLMRVAFKRAEAICTELRAAFVPESALGAWAQRTAKHVQATA
jgi:Protein of unknown function (DUF3037)